MIDSFDKPNGKFADNIGNVALVDCNDVRKLLPFPIDLCNITATVNGVLDDQAKVYT